MQLLPTTCCGVLQNVHKSMAGDWRSGHTCMPLSFWRVPRRAKHIGKHLLAVHPTPLRGVCGGGVGEVAVMGGGIEMFQEAHQP